MPALLLHEIGHILIYLLAVSALYLFGKRFVSWKNFWIGFLAAIFIDVDHVIDYLIYKGYLTFDIWEFLSGCYFSFNGRAYVIFHAWEYIILLFLLFLDERLKRRHSWMLFVTVGMAAHLVFDIISYGFSWDFYFISSRVFNSFRFGG